MFAAAGTGGALSSQVVASAVTVGIATAVVLATGIVVGRFLSEPLARYHARKLIRSVVVLLTVVALSAIWRAFAGRAAEILGFAAAGIAFAMQETIGAVAGWFNIVSGGLFRVGDRVEMSGVRGDVIDITLLRTKLMEIGSATEGGTWVKGRQYTGRVVALSNKATFTAPVYNFSALIDFVWEEMTFPIAYRSDWKQAEQLILDEVRKVTTTQGADQAVRQMSRRFPIAQAEVEPRVFVRATEDYLELSARFPVPIRGGRSTKDGLTRRIYERLRGAGIEIGSSTTEVTVYHPSSDGASDT
jgi:small-conductance mechanosensitive channel